MLNIYQPHFEHIMASGLTSLETVTMFKRHYEAVARKQRLAEKALRDEAAGTGDWHQWGSDDQPKDVGNLSRTQLLAYLIEQRKAEAAK